MAKRGSCRTAYTLTFAVVFVMLFPAMYASASEEVVSFEAGYFNAERDGEVTINYAEPQISAPDMWQNRPNGIYHGPISPPSMYAMNNWITADSQQESISFFIYASDLVVASGASEFWLRGPLDTTNAHFSFLKIWKLSSLNFTWSGLGEPMTSTTVNCSNHNILGIHNGYTAQFANWNDIVDLGGYTTSPYCAYHHIYAPIYPNTYYLVTQTLSYEHTGTDFYPTILISDEDVYNDNTAFFVYNGTGGFTTNMQIDPDSALLFIAGMIGGRAFIKLSISYEDYIYFRTQHTTAGIRYYLWVYPLYTDRIASYWNVTHDGYINNQSMPGGAIIHSSESAYGLSSSLAELRYLYKTGGGAIDVYLPCISNATQSDGYSMFRLYDNSTGVATASRNFMAINWTYGYLTRSFLASPNLNNSLWYYDSLNAQDYVQFENKVVIATAGGSAKSPASKIFNGVLNTVIYTGSRFQHYSLTASAVLQSKWNSFKGNMPTVENFKVAMQEFLETAYNFTYNMINATWSWTKAVMGEAVDRLQAMWEHGIDWLGNYIKNLIRPIMKVVHEIWATIQKVVEVIINAIEYLITVIMQVVILAVTIPTILALFMPYAVPSFMNRYIEANDPSSPHYKELKERESE